MKIYSLLSYCAVFSILLPLSIAVVRFKDLGREMKILALLLGFGAITELSANILANNKINNLPILHLYSVVEFSLLFTIYYSFFQGLISRRVYRLGIAGFLTLAIINVVLFQGLQAFNTYPLLVECTVFTALSLLFFYQTLKEKKVLHIEQSAMFWFSSGHLIYFAGNLSIFTFSNFILEISNQLHEGIWAIHSVFLIILYITYSISLLCR